MDDTEMVEEIEEVKEEFDNTDINVCDEIFLNNLNSTLGVKRDYQNVQYDHEWLLIIEDTLPYLDNIIRNPKRFIINEEEIVKVELAKRVTVESVIHLTQHTNLIQDIDDNGDVKPSKILNINREESLDTYENRFIYTLINNMRVFLDQRLADSGANSFYIDKKDLTYEANTKVGTENVKISLAVHSYDKNVTEVENVNNMTFAERIEKINMQIDGLVSSELYLTLNKLHVPPVRSPIRKTNVILKNPNFRKAEDLWNYIQSYVSKDKKDYDKRDYYDRGNLKNEYDSAVLMAYIATKTFTLDNGGASEIKVINEMIQRLIENILDTDIDISEDKLKELFLKQIKLVKEKNKARSQSVLRIFEDRFTREKLHISNEIELLRNEG